jgi:hypothetical protein
VQYDAWTARFVFFFPALLACAVAALPRPLAVAALAGIGSYANLWEARVPLPFTPPGAVAFMQALPIADRDSWVISFGGASAEYRPFLASTAPVLAMTFNYWVYALSRGTIAVVWSTSASRTRTSSCASSKRAGAAG